MLVNNILIVMASKKTNRSRISRESGVAMSTISKIVKEDSDVKLSTLIKLCDTLGVPLSELIEYTPN